MGEGITVSRAGSSSKVKLVLTCHLISRRYQGSTTDGFVDEATKDVLRTEALTGWDCCS